MITLYGVAHSRAFRSVWMLEETGRAYRHEPVDFSGGSRQADFLALNPNGRVPCLVDDELVLFESLAINLYLARRYAPTLLPSNVADDARALQWTFWSTNELDAPLAVLTLQGLVAKEKRDAARIEQAHRDLQAPLRVLDAQLALNPFLLGSEFCVADLNVASVAAATLSARVDLTAFPNVARWLGQCLQRPAAQRAVALAIAATKK